MEEPSSATPLLRATDWLTCFPVLGGRAESAPACRTTFDPKHGLLACWPAERSWFGVAHTLVEV